MKSLIILIVAIIFSTAANACQCAFLPINTQSVREAKNVFIFRLLSAELQNINTADPLSGLVIGKIQVVETLRGSTNAKAIRYSTLYFCCGSRLDVGKYYAAFTSEVGMQLSANFGNLIEIGDMYVPKKDAFRAKIESVLTGNVKLAGAFSEHKLNRTAQIPFPPAPPNDKDANK